MEHWKRKQMRLNYRWDLTGFEEEEVCPFSSDSLTSTVALPIAPCPEPIDVASWGTPLGVVPSVRRKENPVHELFEVFIAWVWVVCLVAMETKLYSHKINYFFFQVCSWVTPSSVGVEYTAQMLPLGWCQGANNRGPPSSHAAVNQKWMYWNW